jgi:hypothetical protein
MERLAGRGQRQVGGQGVEDRLIGLICTNTSSQLALYWVIAAVAASIKSVGEMRAWLSTGACVHAFQT